MGKSEPSQRIRRGATINPTSRRFALPESLSDGDWLNSQAAIDGMPPPLRTSVTVERARTILSRNSSPDVPFDRSINPYRGCEHPPYGCVVICRRTAKV